jgi:integrase
MPRERKNEAIWLSTEKRWLIQIQVDGKRKKFYSSTEGRRGKIQAEKKADDWLMRETFAESLRVQEVFASFITDMKEQDMYYQQYESIGNVWILPSIGKKRFINLVDADFQDILNTAYKKGLTKKSIQNIRGCVTKFLKYARQHGNTKLRPELEINKKAHSLEKRSLEDSEIQIIFSNDSTARNRHVSVDWYRYMYRFAIATGLRPGELCGLKYSDVSGEYITIRRAINANGDITSGKNENARRTFKLNTVALSVLEEHITMLKNSFSEIDWLFPQEDGRPTSEQIYYRRFKAYCKYNGIENITPYEIRHTYVSINKEMPVDLLKIQVGHSQAMQTREQYSHQRLGDSERAAELSSIALENILSDPKVTP